MPGVMCSGSTTCKPATGCPSPFKWAAAHLGGVLLRRRRTGVLDRLLERGTGDRLLSAGEADRPRGGGESRRGLTDRAGEASRPFRGGDALMANPCWLLFALSAGSQTQLAQVRVACGGVKTQLKPICHRLSQEGLQGARLPLSQSCTASTLWVLKFLLPLACREAIAIHWSIDAFSCGCQLLGP